MPAMTVTLEEPAWPELANETLIHTTSEIKVAVLDHGMQSGQPSVAFRIDLDEAIRVGLNEEGGKVVIAETSARLFCSAAKIIMAKYPNLFKDN